MRRMSAAERSGAPDVIREQRPGYSLVVSNARRRPGATRLFCRACRKPFVCDPIHGWKATLVVVETTEVSWFRGEDKCHLFHPECKP